jgi:hypothetical protein
LSYDIGRSKTEYSTIDLRITVMAQTSLHSLTVTLLLLLLHSNLVSFGTVL